MIKTAVRKFLSYLDLLSLPLSSLVGLVEGDWGRVVVRSRVGGWAADVLVCVF